MGGSPGDVGEAKEGFENELWRRWSWAHSPTFASLHLRYSSLSKLPVVLPTSELILQPFRCFTYVTTHSPTPPSFYLRQSSFSNPSVTSPTSQFILQPFFRFSYVTSSSLNSPGEPPMVYYYPAKVPVCGFWCEECGETHVHNRNNKLKI